MNQNDKALKVFSYYWKHLKSYPHFVAGIIFSLPITVLLNSYLPALVLADVLSRLSQHDYVAHDIWASFGSQIIIYLSLILAGMLMWRMVDFFTWRLEGNITEDMAEEVLDHMLNQSTDFHANNFTGSLVSKTNKLIGGYIRAADTTIYQVYTLVAGIIIAAAIMASRAPLYAIMLVAFSVFYIFMAFKVSRPVRYLSAKTAAAESQQTGYLADAITNVVAIKSFSRGSYEQKRFRKATKFTRFNLLNAARASQKQMNYLGFLSRTMSGLALLMAIVSVMIFNVNIATVFLIFSYTLGIVDQLFTFGNTGLRNYNRSIGDANDMVELLLQKPLVQDPVTPETSIIKTGRVEFKNVTFDHESSNENTSKVLFSNFNLLIEPGEKVGLVGHSGGGKTTLTKLILRFMDVDGGAILIDGQNIANITQDDLRSSISYVPQDPLLFHRTLAENISYGKENATNQEIIRVAKLAHSHEFIRDLPNGYDTLVGERGIKLSGGQRQRVAIARAMLKDAPILALDEATSSLDSESELLIQDALWKLMEGRTAIVIAHRLSTIQRMDRIIVLDEGKIVEQGSHKDLLEKDRVYAKLWAHQSGGFLED